MNRNFAAQSKSPNLFHRGGGHEDAATLIFLWCHECLNLGMEASDVMIQKGLILGCNARTSAKDEGKLFGLTRKTRILDSKTWASARGHCNDLLLDFIISVG